MPYLSCLKLFFVGFFFSYITKKSNERTQIIIEFTLLKSCLYSHKPNAAYSSVPQPSIVIQNPFKSHNRGMMLHFGDTFLFKITPQTQKGSQFKIKKKKKKKKKKERENTAACQI